MAWIDFLAAQLWQHVWAVIPLALIVAAACRLSRCGPVTRHGLWVVVLVWFVLSPLLPKAPSAGWLRGLEADFAAEARPEPTASLEVAVHAHATSVTAPEAPASYILPRRPARTIPPQASNGAQCARAAVPRREHPADRAPVNASERLRPPSVEPDATWGTSRDGFAIDPFELAADAAAPPRASNTDGAAPVIGTTPPTERHSAIATCSVRPGTGDGAQPAPAPPAPPARLRGDETDATRSTAATAPNVHGNEAVATPVPRAWHVWWRSWVAAALVVRATLARLPAIPAGVWLAGAALVLSWNMLGVMLFWRRMRRSVRPPAWVVSEVRWVARRLKLRQVPTIRMVHARIPPLVWCGWQPVLVLPVELWRTLDSIGRCAILCHELAHLRRRDHWVRRLDMLVALLFWWHPVAWWTRRRVEDEADTCCDAWVTWLMPRERRAYAEALLKTRVFIEKTKRATPVLGAAVTTSGAKRLARRVTMVMTQSVRPRQSVSGFMLAAVMVGLGWLLTPAVSVAQQAPAMAPAAAVDAPHVAVFAATPPPPDRAAPAAPAVPLFTPPAREAPASPWVMAGEANAGDETAQPVTRTYKLAPGKLEALADLLAREDVPLRIRRQADAIEVIAPPRDQDAFAAFIHAIDAQPEEKAWREYPLPAGKRAALYELMARQDVPIVVSQEDGVLQAEVTPSQDAILRGFLALINPDSATAPPPRATSRGGRQRSTGVPAPIPTPIPPPTLYGVTVPILPVPPVGPTPPTPPMPPMARPARPEPAARARTEARQAYTQQLRAREDAKRAKAEAKAALLRQKAAEVLEQAAQLEAQVAKLQAEMERLSEIAAESSGNAAQERQLRAQARELERNARQLERQMERLNELSESLEDRASAEDARVEELNSKVEEFESQLDELEDEADEGAEDEDEDSSVSVWGADDAVVLSDLAPAFFDLAATYRSEKLWQDAYPFHALKETYPIGTPGLPLVVQPQVSIALQKALEGVRSAAGGVRTTVRDEVRQSLRTAFAGAGRAVDLADRDLDQLSDQISALVDAKISAAIERALAGVELRVSVNGLPCQVTAEAVTSGGRAEAQRPDVVEAEEREPLP